MEELLFHFLFTSNWCSVTVSRWIKGWGGMRGRGEEEEEGEEGWGGGGGSLATLANLNSFSWTSLQFRLDGSDRGAAGGLHFRKRHILFPHPHPPYLLLPHPPPPSSLLKCCSDGCPAWCCLNIKYKNVLFGQRAHEAPAETDLMRARVHQRSPHVGLEGPGAELRGPGPSWQGKIFFTLLGAA